MREYVLVLLIALAATYLSAPMCRSLALRLGAVAMAVSYTHLTLPTKRIV